MEEVTLEEDTPRYNHGNTHEKRIGVWQEGSPNPGSLAIRIETTPKCKGSIGEKGLVLYIVAFQEILCTFMGLDTKMEAL